MFRRLFDDAATALDLVNAVATGITRFARVTMRTTALTQREKVTECYRLTGLYRAVVWHRVLDFTDEAGEIAILLGCVTPDCGNEWGVANRLYRHYVCN